MKEHREQKCVGLKRVREADKTLDEGGALMRSYSRHWQDKDMRGRERGQLIWSLIG